MTSFSTIVGIVFCDSADGWLAIGTKKANVAILSVQSRCYNLSQKEKAAIEESKRPRQATNRMPTPVEFGIAGETAPKQENWITITYDDECMHHPTGG